MSPAVLILIASAYLLLLFGVAWWGDARAARGRSGRRPWAWSLALAVYCTSWTYYGAVGRAAESGWAYLPIYLGPILVFVFGHRLITRMISLAKRNSLTSLADFIAARYGRDQRIAVVITLISVLAVLPYMALQLKAIAVSFQVLAPATVQDGLDVALFSALALGLFAILFGTRHISSTESHHGMVLAVAFESLVKLAAFFAVVVLVFVASSVAARAEAWALPPVVVDTSFMVQTVLAGLAVLCLPRQFHITVVENADVRDMRTARWLFPLYLLLISLPVLPLARYGAALFGPGVHADTYMLALPLAMGSEGLAAFVFIGGFSAATAMVIVAAVALSTMISNEVVMPWLLHRGYLVRRRNWGALLKTVRRSAIGLLLLGAYISYQFIAAEVSLAALGLVAFVGIAQLAPSLIGALYWRGGHARGVLAGLFTGAGLWIYTLLLPIFFEGASWLREGPLGLTALAPHGLFGLSGLDPVSHAALVSLGGNLLCFVLISLMIPQKLQDKLDAARFLEPLQPAGPPAARVADLALIVERFFGADRSHSLLQEFSRRHGAGELAPDQMAPAALVAQVEGLLASTMGGSTARALLASMLGDEAVADLPVRVLDQTSSIIRYTRERAQSTLDHLTQGVSVVDGELRLVSWNAAYQRLFDLPEEMLRVGEPVETILRFNAARGLLGEGDAELAVVRRLDHLRAKTPYRVERRLPDGRYLEVRGEPMPGGGFVSTFTDVSDYRQAQDELRRANLELEARVAERTHAAQAAREEAEAANRSKTRFLAAASHDLMQPLNAARLFASAAAGKGQAPAELLQGIEQSLGSMEELLGSLLDISKLDAGVLPVQARAVPLAEIFKALAMEFSLTAQRRGLDFRVHPSRLWVHVDPALLRRVLQNFLSNAVRYTPRGRVVLGARRCGDQVRIEVLDQGPGIAPLNQARVFEEFSRLGARDAKGERGFGLGLAICQRIAGLMDWSLELRSQPGRGSAFCISVPRTSAAPQAAPSHIERVPGTSLRGRRVLCLDNDPDGLAGMQALLGGWGCVVRCARDEREARQALSGQGVDIILADFHLDQNANGVAVAQALKAAIDRPIPVIIITADYSGEADKAATQAGFPVLKKPLKPAALRALMTRVLRS